ncbi:L-threonylcarbamoyladenylate synthase [Novosphingobium sp. Leaf2]|uniref:L-threonylcarbamoyladenylate synthase n=1 Tax=Novosphingobium sp. Leaf2 TaxID=1735670 RepID=UPI0006FA23E5|nr:L-threonylcarbamoyladenylate synthase [Novosphingobium sp. Leaf2]KQM21842.1 translation factor Sua5 [Novosphingobium sp. Leaf2]
MDHASRPMLLAPDQSGIALAAQILRDGGLVASPSETVYGLMARADQQEAVAAIYTAKGRPSFNPLIVHVADTAMAQRLAVFDERARRLADAFWPGPLTLVLPLQMGAAVAPSVIAGLPTLAVRCPAHPVLRALIAETRLPLAGPSANRSGGVSPTRTEHVVASLGDRVDAVIDGGTCAQGLESTIVALRPSGSWQVLRPGPITEAQIAAVLYAQSDAVCSSAIEAPGQLSSHYAPGKPVRLEATQRQDDEFHIGFGTVAGHANLSPDGDLAEAAANLYALLHQAADADHPRIAVAPVPDAGIGVAINDRLRRAAA